MTHTFAVVAALGCALTWAFASVAFARVLRGNEGVDAHALNLIKCAIAFPCLVGGGVVVGAGLPVWEQGVGWLVFSSFLGLVVADSGYFIALRRLGAARGVLFIPLVPVATAVLAALFLDEPITARIALGIVITLAGLFVVLVQPEKTTSTTKLGWFGIVGGVVYALSQAGANVVTKHVLEDSLAIHVAALRIGIGALMLFVISACAGSLPGLKPLLVPKVLGVIVVASIIGTVGGMWLGMIATKGLPVGVATTLAATTPLWAIGLSRLSGESITARALAGSILAVVGVIILASSSST
ncbi:MAG: DMT family transporter [Deltaproteobacteria bacterium]|nr:DMT family transporter [Deltaproteobacteria bacterium]